MFDSIFAVLGQIVTLSNIFFCMAIAGLVELQKKAVELASNKWFPSFYQSRLWKELLVPLGPLGTGMGLALTIKSYPYPEMFTSGGSRMIFGVGCGLISGLVFTLVKKNLAVTIQNLAAKFKSDTGIDKSE